MKTRCATACKSTRHFHLYWTTPDNGPFPCAALAPVLSKGLCCADAQNKMRISKMVSFPLRPSTGFDNCILSDSPSWILIRLSHKNSCLPWRQRYYVYVLKFDLPSTSSHPSSIIIHHVLKNISAHLPFIQIYHVFLKSYVEKVYNYIVNYRICMCLSYFHIHFRVYLWLYVCYTVILFN